MRKGDYKATSVAKPYGSEVWGLYNTKQDPGETNDLSEQLPDLKKELTEGWNAYTKKVGAIIGVGPPVIEGKASQSQENQRSAKWSDCRKLYATSGVRTVSGDL